MYDVNSADSLQQDLKKLRRVVTMAKRYQSAVLHRRNIRALANAPALAWQVTEKETRAAELALLQVLQEWDKVDC